MNVTVKYRAHLTAFTNVAEEQIEAATVNDVLRHIKAQYGAETGKKAKSMIIVVNGESILQLSHFKTALQNGDEVSFFPVSCGG
jgi:MoaD family protein